jgi:Zn/Cd-binding protein ZinT
MNVQDLFRGYSIGYATDLHRVPLTEDHVVFCLGSINSFWEVGKGAKNGVQTLFTDRANSSIPFQFQLITLTKSIDSDPMDLNLSVEHTSRVLES